MANKYSANPIELDTVMVNSVVVNFNVTAVYWYNPTNIGDTVLVTHDEDQTLFEGRAETAGGSQLLTFAQGIPITTIKLSSISSGKIYVYGYRT